VIGTVGNTGRNRIIKCRGILGKDILGIAALFCSCFGAVVKIAAISIYLGAPGITVV
jgi:hypothetical protein